MDLLSKIFDAGIVGAGGAGFPTHMKLNCQVEYFLINAAECEPLLNTDKFIMDRYPDEIVEAVEAVSAQVSARETYIAVKKVNDKVITRLQEAIDKRRSFVKIFALDNYYPAGDEQMIVYDVTGRTVTPGGIPLSVGCVVSNVATMLHIYEALSDKPVTHKYLTVAGEVNQPIVLKVPVGTPFAECLEAAGGPTINDYKIVSGGPMMGKVSAKESLAELTVSKTTSGILIVPTDSNFIARTDALSVRQILNRAKSACIQCKFCTDLCPRKLIGHNLNPNLVMRHMTTLDLDEKLEKDEVLEQALICCECGVCETFACPMGLSPRQVNKYVKKELAARPALKDEDYTASPLREYRKIAPKKIMARMGLLDLYNRKVDQYRELEADCVKLALRQSIGAPAAPVVAVGEQVKVGQLIAKAAEGPPSANLHASLDGTIIEITKDTITIKGGMC